MGQGPALQSRGGAQGAHEAVPFGVGMRPGHLAAPSPTLAELDPVRGFSSQGGPYKLRLPQTSLCFGRCVGGWVLGARGGETAGPPSQLGPSGHPTRDWLVLRPVASLVPQQETGFWFIFHHVPTGPSVGMYSPGYSEHIPLGKFHNNRAHSNYRVSLSGPPAGTAWG